MDIRPLIGITPGFTDSNNRLYIGKGYVDGVNKAGGIGLLLPLTADEKILEEAVGRVDGILLSGGPDLDAMHFSEENYKYNWEISPVRDAMELFAARRAISLNKPVLGICRGAQVLNVALGGSLYQDIHSQIKGRELLKHSQEAPGWYPVHDIITEEGSWVRMSFGRERARVNSFHHQAVKEPGRGFRVTSLSSDGIVESVELAGGLFAVGVQWHPELMWQEDPQYLKLFELFVEAAGKW